MPKLPKVEESAFSANHFLLKLIVPRAQPSALAQTDPPASPELATCLSCSARPIARDRVTDRQGRHWRAGHQYSILKKPGLE